MVFIEKIRWTTYKWITKSLLASYNFTLGLYGETVLLIDGQVLIPKKKKKVKFLSQKNSRQYNRKIQQNENRMYYCSMSHLLKSCKFY